MPTKKTAVGIGVVLIVASVGFAIASHHRQSQATADEKGSTAAVQKPTPPIPGGEQDYRVQQDANAKPRITNVSIDPPDVRPGYKQTLSITIESESKSVTVSTETKTDNKTVSFALDLVKEDGPRKTFAKTWTVEDTHDATYYTKFIAQDGNDRNEITLAWTDPCGIPNGGDCTMTSNCTISGLDGVDNGNATIQSGTLTLNAPFVFNAGKSFSVTGGTILIGSGAEIRKGNLYAVDADHDGYPAAGFSTSTGVRRYTFASSSAVDCYDSNANAHPGQTNYYTTNRGDGSFDYDCNTNEEYQYADSGSAWCGNESGNQTDYACVVWREGWDGAAPYCGNQGANNFGGSCVPGGGGACVPGNVVTQGCR